MTSTESYAPALHLHSHANAAFSGPFRSWHAKDGSFHDGYSNSHNNGNHGFTSIHSHSAFVPSVDMLQQHPTSRSRGGYDASHHSSSGDKVYKHFMNDGWTDFHAKGHRINTFTRHSTIPMQATTPSTSSSHTSKGPKTKPLKPLQPSDYYMESHLCKNESDPSNLFDFELLRGVINARVGMKVAAPDTIPCKYGPKCFRKDCRFSHRIPREYDLLSFSLASKPASTSVPIDSSSSASSTCASSPMNKLSPMSKSVSSVTDTDDSLDLDLDAVSPCSTARLSSEETRCTSVLSDSCAQQDSDSPDV